MTSRLPVYNVRPNREQCFFFFFYVERDEFYGVFSRVYCDRVELTAPVVRGVVRNIDVVFVPMRKLKNIADFASSAQETPIFVVKTSSPAKNRSPHDILPVRDVYHWSILSSRRPFSAARCVYKTETETKSFSDSVNVFVNYYYVMCIWLVKRKWKKHANLWLWQRKKKNKKKTKIKRLPNCRPGGDAREKYGLGRRRPPSSSPFDTPWPQPL